MYVCGLHNGFCRVKETTGEFKGFKEALLGPRQRLDTDGKRVMTGG